MAMGSGMAMGGGMPMPAPEPRHSHGLDLSEIPGPEFQSAEELIAAYPRLD